MFSPCNIAQIEIARTIGHVFPNTLPHDVVFYTTNPNQKIMIGPASVGRYPLLTLHNSNVTIRANTTIDGPVSIGNLMTPRITFTKTNIQSTTPYDITESFNSLSNYAHNIPVQYIMQQIDALSNYTYNDDIQDMQDIRNNIQHINTQISAFSNIDYTATQISNHLLPSTDQQYDLGSENKRFRDIYLSSNSIYMGHVKIGLSNNILVAEGADAIYSQKLMIGSIAINDPMDSNMNAYILDNLYNIQNTLDDVYTAKDNIVPIEHAVFDIGNESFAFNNLYLNQNGGAIKFGSNASIGYSNNRIVADGGADGIYAKSLQIGSLQIVGEESIDNALLDFANNFSATRLNSVDVDITPTTSNTYDLGSSFLAFKDLYLDGVIHIGNNTIAINQDNRIVIDTLSINSIEINNSSSNDLIELVSSFDNTYVSIATYCNDLQELKNAILNLQSILDSIV